MCTENDTIEEIREEFPTLNQTVHGNQLVYLDGGATILKPQSVINAVTQFYAKDNSNIHRGVHSLSQRATEQYETVREKAKHFLNARDSKEIVFTSGATAAINLIAETFAEKYLKSGDEIIITAMEHHSNIVPWQRACEKMGAILKVIPIDDNGELILAEYEKLLSKKTKLVACMHVSNVLGTINPVKKITKLAHDVGAKVLIDGAQAAPHMRIDVQDIDCDFYAISGHKMYGPTGVGILYGKYELLDSLPPYQTGGSMITRVTFEKTDYAKPPAKFEAGTPNIAGVIGLGAAIDFMNSVGVDAIQSYEKKLCDYMTEQLQQIPGLRIIGNAEEKAGVVSFTIEHIHPHDIGTILDCEGVAVRAGHHCTMPLMQRFNVPATVRASLGVYNNFDDIDRLVVGLKKVIEMFN